MLFNLRYIVGVKKKRKVENNTLIFSSSTTIMVLTNSWSTTIALDEEQNSVVVTQRKEIEAFRSSGKLPYRIEIVFPYKGDSLRMPLEEDAKSIGDIEEALRPSMEKDKLAILTGNYLGGNKKYWVFYTRNVDAFFDRLNECLEELSLIHI